ncbi:MAG: phosphatase family protein [Segetibacter sp.]|nr:phosphatase family protein [Segetibacter sp.]
MIIQSRLLKSILGLVCSFFFLITHAQTWEIDAVRNANPQNPNSTVWKYASQSAKPISVGLPAAMLATGFFTHDKKLREESLEMFGSLVITFVATEGLKRLVDRQRPYQKYTGVFPDEYEDGESFPSGHTSVAFSTATSLSINHPKWYVIVPAYGWAVGVGYSRMYLGQHYPTDLLGSAIVGAGSAVLSHRVNKWIQKKKNKKEVSKL